MNQIYAFNTLAEYQAQGVLSPPLQLRLSLLEKIAFVLSDPDDRVATSDPVETAYTEHWKNRGFDLGKEIPLSQIQAPTPDHQNKPSIKIPSLGGNSDSLVEWADFHDWRDGKMIPSPTKQERFRYFNSKRTQYKWKDQLSLSPIPFRFLHSLTELESLEKNQEYVLKSSLGVAGREHTVLNSETFAQKKGYIQNKHKDFPLVLEEWKGEKRILDFSSLWDGADGKPELLGFTEMFIDTDGTFRGIKLSSLVDSKLLPYKKSIQKTMLKLFENENSSLLKDKMTLGPMAMDGFLFEDRGSIILQPFSEINFRWSMGRVLLEFQKRLNRKNHFPSSIAILLVPIQKETIPLNYDLYHSWETELGIRVFPLTPQRNFEGKLYPQLGLILCSDEKELDLSGLFRFFRGLFSGRR